MRTMKIDGNHGTCNVPTYLASSAHIPSWRQNDRHLCFRDSMTTADPETCQSDVRHERAVGVRKERTEIVLHER